jgi:hypothetical protein
MPMIAANRPRSIRLMLNPIRCKAVGSIVGHNRLLRIATNLGVYRIPALSQWEVSTLALDVFKGA